jgi:hypothetical protein
MNTKSVRLLLLLSFIICLSPFISAQSSPEDIVKRFCTIRYDGSEYQNSGEYGKLTVWWGPDFDEPGWDRFFVVDTFSIVKSRLYGYVTYVDVKFHSYGMYDGGKWLSNDTSEIRQYILFNTIDGWKIYNIGENPRISVGAFLKDAYKGLDGLYKESQSDKSNKAANDEYTRMYNDRKKLISDLELIVAKRSQQKH